MKNILFALILVFSIYGWACPAWIDNDLLCRTHSLIAPTEPNLADDHERISKDCPKLVAEFGGELYGYDSMAISGIYAFLGGGGNLFIFDISDPLQAHEVSTYRFGAGYVNSLTKDGNFIHATYWYFEMLRDYWDTCFAILDVSDVNNVRKLGQYCHSSVEGEFTYYNPAIYGNYAFVEGPGIQVFDISDKQHPFPLKNYPDYGFADMEIVDQYGYTDEVAIYDVSDPLNIVRIGYLEIASIAFMALSADHDYEYVAGGPTYLYVVDVSQIADPKLVSTLYVNIKIFDISVQDIILGIVGEGPFSDTDEIEIFNISNPASPEGLGSYTVANAGSLLQIAIKDKYAFVRTYGKGIFVFDLSACKASGHRRPVTRP